MSKSYLPLSWWSASIYWGSSCLHYRCLGRRDGYPWKKIDQNYFCSQIFGQVFDWLRYFPVNFQFVKNEFFLFFDLEFAKNNNPLASLFHQKIQVSSLNFMFLRNRHLKKKTYFADLSSTRSSNKILDSEIEFHGKLSIEAKKKKFFALIWNKKNSFLKNG